MCQYNAVFDDIRAMYVIWNLWFFFCALLSSPATFVLSCLTMNLLKKTNYNCANTDGLVASMCYNCVFAYCTRYKLNLRMQVRGNMRTQSTSILTTNTISCSIPVSVYCKNKIKNVLKVKLPIDLLHYVFRWAHFIEN